MKRSCWTALTLPLLMSCNGSPTGPPPSMGQVSLEVANTAVSMSLLASTPHRADTHQFRNSAPWTSSQPNAQFDESYRVTVQDDSGDAQIEAALSCWTNVGTADGIALATRVGIDGLGRASRAATSSASWRADIATRFEVASGSMRYQVRFDPETAPEPGTQWFLALRLVRLDGGTAVFDELHQGAELANRTLAGTLPPGLYVFAFTITSSSTWQERGPTPVTGDARLWFSVN